MLSDPTYRIIQSVWWGQHMHRWNINHTCRGFPPTFTSYIYYNSISDYWQQAVAFLLHNISKIYFEGNHKISNNVTLKQYILDNCLCRWSTKTIFWYLLYNQSYNKILSSYSISRCTAHSISPIDSNYFLTSLFLRCYWPGHSLLHLLLLQAMYEVYELACLHSLAINKLVIYFHIHTQASAKFSSHYD